ncbi:MAG: alpha/beta hydrolase [Thermoplasmata archaeon]|nr:alpha/beta hydrolase [Thermoplasmata archaeon]
MPSLQLPDHSLFYEARGAAGDPMVLVHGSWVDHRTWNLVATKLAESFSLVVYDRRGHGRSAPRSGPYRIEDDVADLEELLTRLDHYPAHVVGLSLGGSIAARSAASRPDLFRSLVVHEPPLYGLLGTGSEEVRAFRTNAAEVARRLALGDRAGAAQAFVETVAASPGEWERIGRAGQSLLMAHADRWLEEYEAPGTFELDLGPLAEFFPPALLTSGELSPPIYGRMQDRLAGALPNATRQRLPRTGHLPHLTDPDMFIGVLFSFCAERNVPVS